MGDMEKKFSVRPAEPRDVRALVALINSAYRGDSSRRGWTTEADLLGGQRVDRAMVRQAMKGTGRVILVLERSGRREACVALELRRNRGYLGLLTVRPDRQGQGIGQKLLLAAERWVRVRWKQRRVEMTVLAQRSDLLAWYARQGYRRTGHTRPFPYGDERFGNPKIPTLRFVVLAKNLLPDG
jgi:GNAT superfamily N-acetyltransferase